MKLLNIRIGAGKDTCGRCHMQDRCFGVVRCLLFKRRLKTYLIDVRRKGLKGGKQLVYRCRECLTAEH